MSRIRMIHTAVVNRRLFLTVHAQPGGTHRGGGVGGPQPVAAALGLATGTAAAARHFEEFVRDVA